MKLRGLLLTLLVIVSIDLYSQTDTTKYDKTELNLDTEKAGKLIQSAGLLYNISSAIAIAGSTTGSILISNGDTEAGLIVTSATGLTAYILQTVGNSNLAAGGKQLRSIKQLGSSEVRKLNFGKLSLELRPKFGYRTSSRTSTANGIPVYLYSDYQYYMGNSNIRYSRNNLFIRWGIAGSRVVNKGESLDPDWSVFEFTEGSFGLSTCLDVGLIINDKNEVSFGVNTTTRWNYMSLINLDYAYYFSEDYALSLTLHYDYYQVPGSLMPSIGMIYKLGK